MSYLLKIAVSTNHVVVGIFLIVYSSIDPINTTLPFSLIMCCNNIIHKHRDDDPEAVSEEDRQRDQT